MTETSKFPLTGTQMFIDECNRTKMKRLDLDSLKCDGNSHYANAFNSAFDLLKSKYGDLYVEVKE